MTSMVMSSLGAAPLRCDSTVLSFVIYLISLTKLHFISEIISINAAKIAKIRETTSSSTDFLYLPTVEENLPAIVLRPHGEVNPIGSAALFEDELIEVTLRSISDIQQYPRHPDHVLRAIATDIHRTTRQVIAPLRSSAHPIHFLTPIPASNYDGNIR